MQQQLQKKEVKVVEVEVVVEVEIVVEVKEVVEAVDVEVVKQLQQQ